MTPPWLRIAQQELQAGVREIPGSGNDTRVLEYHLATGLQASQDSVPWCASIVSWCLGRAGVPHPASARARDFLRWGQPLSIPAHGSVGIFQRGRGPQPGPTVVDAPGHVGFLVGEASTDELLVLGGNQSDRVCVRVYSVTALLSCRWPL